MESFQKNGKKAVVTTILKKGDQRDKKNYRPVSCLAAASKVLKKIICEQIMKHMESNNLGQVVNMASNEKDRQ